MLNKHNRFEGKGWIKAGLIWGGFMYIFMTIFFNSLFTRALPTLKDLLIGIPIWGIGGLIFGYLMKSWTQKKTNDK